MKFFIVYIIFMASTVYGNEHQSKLEDVNGFTDPIFFKPEIVKQSILHEVGPDETPVYRSFFDLIYQNYPSQSQKKIAQWLPLSYSYSNFGSSPDGSGSIYRPDYSASRNPQMYSEMSPLAFQSPLFWFMQNTMRRPGALFMLPYFNQNRRPQDGSNNEVNEVTEHTTALLPSIVENQENTISASQTPEGSNTHGTTITNGNQIYIPEEEIEHNDNNIMPTHTLLPTIDENQETTNSDSQTPEESSIHGTTNTNNNQIDVPEGETENNDNNILPLAALLPSIDENQENTISSSQSLDEINTQGPTNTNDNQIYEPEKEIESNGNNTMPSAALLPSIDENQVNTISGNQTFEESNNTHNPTNTNDNQMYVTAEENNETNMVNSDRDVHNSEVLLINSENEDKKAPEEEPEFGNNAVIDDVLNTSGEEGISSPVKQEYTHLSENPVKRPENYNNVLGNSDVDIQTHGPEESPDPVRKDDKPAEPEEETPEHSGERDNGPLQSNKVPTKNPEEEPVSEGEADPNPVQKDEVAQEEEIESKDERHPLPIQNEDKLSIVEDRTPNLEHGIGTSSLRNDKMPPEKEPEFEDEGYPGPIKNEDGLAIEEVETPDLEDEMGTISSKNEKISQEKEPESKVENPGTIRNTDIPAITEDRKKELEEEMGISSLRDDKVPQEKELESEIERHHGSVRNENLITSKTEEKPVLERVIPFQSKVNNLLEPLGTENISKKGKDKNLMKKNHFEDIDLGKFKEKKNILGLNLGDDGLAVDANLKNVDPVLTLLNSNVDVVKTEVNGVLNPITKTFSGKKMLNFKRKDLPAFRLDRIYSA